MISVKSKSELEKMRKIGVITANALHFGGQSIRDGMTTYELDKIIHDYIVRHGAKAMLKGYGGFPASCCISINEQLIHGIPSKKVKIREGDIVSVDVSAEMDGFHGDTAYTFACGKISKEAEQLLKVTNESLYKGIEQAVPGNRIGDIGHAVEKYCTAYGYSVCKKYIGHGIGRKLHEDPEVPNYGKEGHGPRLVAGMTICIEPMINAVGEDVRVLPDGWTVVTKSGSLAAHFEHTVAVTPDGPVILTKPAL
ncbi:MAG: type I methionyl aminopeptidase [Prevotella sp.]|nr:type I methionyl aminopeptidase [Prevotella sp.]